MNEDAKERLWDGQFSNAGGRAGGIGFTPLGLSGCISHMVNADRGSHVCVLEFGCVVEVYLLGTTGGWPRMPGLLFLIFHHLAFEVAKIQPWVCLDGQVV